MLLHGGAEAVPAELAAIADVVSVYFPWAALLRAVLGTNSPALEGIARLAKKDARVEIVLSADRARDGALDGIPILDAPFVRGELAEAYARAGLTLRHATTRGRQEVQAIPTSWAKRLGHGAPRAVWRLVAIK